MTRRNVLIGALRLGATLAALAAVFLFTDSGKLLDRLVGTDPAWLAAALAAATLQYPFSALRWRYMTRVFGGDLSLRRAVPEYFLAVFLNQTLPGGVPGDVVRAVRDRNRARGDGPNANGTATGLRRHTEGLGAAARGVALERASGQIALVLVALVGVLVLPGVSRDRLPLEVVAAVVLGTLVVVTLVMLGLRALAARGWRRPQGALDALRDARTALFGPRHFVMHIALSLPVVGSFLGTFWLAARSIGITLEPAAAVGLVPLVLLAMVVPVTVGGWGVREGAAAGLLTLAGLQAHQGVAASVLYGAVILASSLPGAWVLLRR